VRTRIAGVSRLDVDETAEGQAVARPAEDDDVFVVVDAAEMVHLELAVAWSGAASLASVAGAVERGASPVSAL
jgi:hypothetical protein